MIGLIAFGSMALWLALSLWIAWRMARSLRRSSLKALVLVVVAPLLVAAPLADEIVGKYQFESYCEGAKEAKVYGTIPVGEDLYTPEGKWRLDDSSRMPLEDFNRLNNLIESLIRWDRGPSLPREMHALIPIHEYKTKLIEAKTDRLLAEYQRYSNGGGWLKRNFGVGAATGGFLLPQVCVPEVVRRNRLIQVLLPFERAKKEGK